MDIAIAVLNIQHSAIDGKAITRATEQLVNALDTANKEHMR